jgi:hypothetical protein
MSPTEFMSAPRVRVSQGRRALPVLLAVMMAAQAASATAPRSLSPASPARPARPTSSATGAPITCLGEALGGIERLARFRSLYLKYQIEVGGLTGTDEFWHDARGAQRESLDVPGAFTDVVVFDGTNGWQRGASGTVMPMSGVDLADVVTQAYLGSYMHLIQGRMPGAVRRLGVDREHRLVRLRIAPEGGTAVTLALDTVTCLPAKLQQSQGSATLVSTFSDWRDVSGIKLPFAIQQSAGNPNSDVRLTLLVARLDEPLPPRAFAKPVPTGSEPQIANGAPSIDVPFELVSNKPFLAVSVASSPPLSFLFDTGSPGMMLDRDRAQSLGLKLEGSASTGGAGAGRLELSFVRHVDVAIDSLQAPALNFSVSPFKASSTAEGREIGGLVGYDLASHFVVNIDYAAGRFRFFDPEQYRYRGARSGVRYSIIYGGLMVVPATLTLANGDTIRGRFVVDTGVRNALTLNHPFAEKNRLATRLPAGPEGTVGYGLGGDTRGRVTRAKSLRIGALTFGEPVTILSLDKSGVLASGDFDGIIGGDLLRRCNVIFDHPNQRMILEPNDAFATPFDYDMSGTFLLGQGDGYKRFLIWRVLPGSPASESGLMEGDVITSVNGIAASALTLEEVRRTLRVEGREVELGIQRGDQSLTMRIKLRRLV